MDKKPSIAELSAKWEELTAPDFIKAVAKAKQTCIVPIGVLEKHGAHLPLGTDLYTAREISTRAARKEYVLIYPEYYFGQNGSAKQQPGGIAYSHGVIWSLLQETCDEICRNGIRKIVIVSSHGGNDNFTRFFCQTQLERKRNYAVVFFQPAADESFEKKIVKLAKTPFDFHGGERETSTTMVHHPRLVRLDEARTQSGADQNRVPGQGVLDGFTGIWWYARFPNHYAGDGRPANLLLGELCLGHRVEQLAKMVKAVKEEKKILRLQDEFYQKAQNPVATQQ